MQTIMVSKTVYSKTLRTEQHFIWQVSTVWTRCGLNLGRFTTINDKVKSRTWKPVKLFQKHQLPLLKKWCLTTFLKILCLTTIYFKINFFRQRFTSSIFLWICIKHATSNVVRRCIAIQTGYRNISANIVSIKDLTKTIETDWLIRRGKYILYVDNICLCGLYKQNMVASTRPRKHKAPKEKHRKESRRVSQAFRRTSQAVLQVSIDVSIVVEIVCI